MVSLGSCSSRAVLSGWLAGFLLLGPTAQAGEGTIPAKRSRTADVSRVDFAEYTQDETSPMPIPESSTANPPLPLYVAPAIAGPFPGCPPVNRLSARVIPYGDSIGTPLHHLNFSGDCYGENWRTRNWCSPYGTSSKDQHRHSHSLGMERWWGSLCGKTPRGYVHDTSGHPMRSFFVPQPADPQQAFSPECDAPSPPRWVIDYSQYVYQPSLQSGPACDNGTPPSGRFPTIPASAQR